MIFNEKVVCNGGAMKKLNMYTKLFIFRKIMKKEYFLYPLIFIISYYANVFTTLIIPPFRAMCPCWFNDVQGYITVYGSAAAAILALYLTHKKHTNGHSYKKAALQGLLSGVAFVALLGIINTVIYEANLYPDKESSLGSINYI